MSRLVFPAFATALISAAAFTQLSHAGSTTAHPAANTPGPLVAHAASESSTTAQALKAAKAFKASLSSGDQAKLQYAFNAPQKESGWSNLPTTLVARVGVRAADLSTAQTAKLQALLKAILSARGYTDVQATRKADTYLAEQQAAGNGNTSTGSGVTGPMGGTSGPGGASGSGGPMGGGPTGASGPGGSGGGASGSTGSSQTLSYGQGLYYVAFYGTPSLTHKWTVQFGGHHLAIHMTFSGSTITDTPFFSGVEPRTPFKVDGKTYAPMAAKASALYGIAKSLTAAQKKQATLSGTFDDVVVGPQKDGQFPTKQGITVTSLSKSQQEHVIRAIKTYVLDEPTTAARKLLAIYEKQLPQTKLAIAGTPDGVTQGGYVRLHGPRLWIEIATQGPVVLTGTHYHSIERDIKSDYGAGT